MDEILMKGPWLSLALGAMGLAALMAARCEDGESARRWALPGFLVSLLASLAAAVEVVQGSGGRLMDPWMFRSLGVDAVTAVPMALFSILALLVALAMPRTETTPKSLAGLAVLSLGTFFAHTAENLFLVAAAWWLTCLPGWLGWWSGGDRGRKVPSSRWFQAAGCVAITLAAMVLGPDPAALEHKGMTPFVLLLFAVVLRECVLPLHGWLVREMDEGPLLPTALWFNGHLGVLLIARAETLALPGFDLQVLDVLSILALGTALYAAFIAFGEFRPRRILGWLCVSQASFILAGLGSRNVEGIGGALVHWMVVVAATTGLLFVLSAIEARCPAARHTQGDLGLAVRAPRMAVFFLVCGLALVGLPGTLGFCAEDLLFHGALMSHPLLGVLLPVATALNAIHLVRLFMRLFLGVPVAKVPPISDVLPMERLALVCCVLFLVLGGLVPKPWIALRGHAAEIMAQTLGLDGDSH